MGQHVLGWNNYIGNSTKNKHNFGQDSIKFRIWF